MGHIESKGGGRGRRGRTHCCRLTCNRNAQARVTFRLQQVLEDNRSVLRGYIGGFLTEGVSLDSESSGLNGVYLVLCLRI